MKMLSTAEAAQALKRSQRWIREMCERGRFGTRVGGRYVLTEAEVKAFKPRPRGRPSKKSRH